MPSLMFVARCCFPVIFTMGEEEEEEAFVCGPTSVPSPWSTGSPGLATSMETP